jgi:tRNA G10  N-methylase Trm11
MLYYFILGQSPKLSAAEIAAFLQKENLNFKIVKYSEEVLILDLKTELEAEKILDQLGGTVKLGYVLANTEIKKINAEFLTSQLLKSKVQSPESRAQNSELRAAPDYGLRTQSSKFHFGFSTYYLSQVNFHLPRNFGLEVKRLLKERGLSSRLVIDKGKNLSSVTVAKNRLLKNGAEICFLVDNNQIYLGKTLAVQKFGEYSKFDYGRPGRDPQAGMLPPKVAKMMINLASLPATGYQLPAILDPFCGSGTILQEAARLGYQNLIGSDLSPKAVEDTKANFQFLTSHSPHSSFPIPHSSFHVLDARHLSTKIKPTSIDAIITEPHLGPPLRGNEPTNKIQQIIAELSQLYLQALAEFKKVLKPGGKLVIIFPIINGQPSISDQQSEQIKKLGFIADWHLPAELKTLLSPRGSIIYSRSGQRVEREIFVLKSI